MLVNLFLLMVPAGMPELASREDINYLREMLAPNETDEQVCLACAGRTHARTHARTALGLLRHHLVFAYPPPLRPRVVCGLVPGVLSSTLVRLVVHVCAPLLQAKVRFRKEIETALNSTYKRFDNTVHNIVHGM